MTQIIIQNQGSDNLDHFNSCSIHCEQIEGTNNFKYFVKFDKYNGIDIIFTTPNSSLVPLNPGDVFNFEIVTQAQPTFGPSSLLTPSYFIGVFNMDSLEASPGDSINIYFYEFPNGFQLNGAMYAVTPNSYSESDQNIYSPNNPSIVKKKKQVITYASMSADKPIKFTLPKGNLKPIKGNIKPIKNPAGKLVKNVSPVISNNKITGKK